MCSPINMIYICYALPDICPQPLGFRYIRQRMMCDYYHMYVQYAVMKWTPFKTILSPMEMCIKCCLRTHEIIYYYCYWIHPSCLQWSTQNSNNQPVHKQLCQTKISVPRAWSFLLNNKIKNTLTCYCWYAHKCNVSVTIHVHSCSNTLSALWLQHWSWYVLSMILHG